MLIVSNGAFKSGSTWLTLVGAVAIMVLASGVLAVRNYTIVIAGAILVAALALVVDGLLALVQLLVTPRGVSRGVTRTKKTGSTATRPPRPLDATRTPVTEG